MLEENSRTEKTPKNCEERQKNIKEGVMLEFYVTKYQTLSA